MNTFVKVEGHPGWLMLISNESEPSLLDELSKTMPERIRRAITTIHSKEVPTWKDKVALDATFGIDYKSLVANMGDLLVRPYGTFMPLRGNVVIESVQSNDFPIDVFADIVVCENDAKGDYKWLAYLKRNFPDMTVQVIPFFDTQTPEYIQYYFENAKIVTFSTTFNDMYWFKKMTRCLHQKNRVLGYTHNPEKWGEAKKICPRVEIVERLE